MKKLMMVLLSLLLLTQSNLVFKVAAIDFSANEDYYFELCSKTGLSADDKAVCVQFQAYLQDKADKVQDELEGISNDIKVIRANLNKYLKDINSYNGQILQLEKDIEKLDASIAELEKNIALIQEQIVKREIRIEELDRLIKTRMAAQQGVSNLNGMVDFLFGAKDFADLLRRIEGIKDITAYDQQQIALLDNEIKALNIDKDELLSQQLYLAEQKQILQQNIESLTQMKAQMELVVMEYRKQEANLVAKQTEVVGNLSAIKKTMDAVSKAINNILPSKGWVYPIDGKFSISATPWAYPEGGTHLGLDLAAKVGLPVVAPGNGLVLYVADRCGTYGYLGSSCGWPGAGGGGNQVLLAIAIGEKVYVLNNFHLSSGVSKVVKIGDIVSQGDVIGYVGSSGSSTGPHLHHEIYYMGKTTIQAVANTFARNGNLNMGTGWGTSALSRRCSSNNYTVPCRENPATIYNVKLWYSYDGD
jgi:murein DD-endopeptidase MepM/ murein hydrolase activator NlpD